MWWWVITREREAILYTGACLYVLLDVMVSDNEREAILYTGACLYVWLDVIVSDNERERGHPLYWGLFVCVARCDGEW